MNLKNTMLMSTFCVSWMNGSFDNYSAKSLADESALPIEYYQLSNAILQLCTTIPGLRNIPPILFLLTLIFSITSFFPTTIDPNGAPRALLKQNITESHFYVNYFTSIFVYNDAWNILAPST